MFDEMLFDWFEIKIDLEDCSYLFNIPEIDFSTNEIKTFKKKVKKLNKFNKEDFYLWSVWFSNKIREITKSYYILEEFDNETLEFFKYFFGTDTLNRYFEQKKEKLLSDLIYLKKYNKDKMKTKSFSNLINKNSSLKEITNTVKTLRVSVEELVLDDSILEDWSPNFESLLKNSKEKVKRFFQKEFSILHTNENNMILLNKVDVVEPVNIKDNLLSIYKDFDQLTWHQLGEISWTKDLKIKLSRITKHPFSTHDFFEKKIFIDFFKNKNLKEKEYFKIKLSKISIWELMNDKEKEVHNKYIQFYDFFIKNKEQIEKRQNICGQISKSSLAANQITFIFNFFKNHVDKDPLKFNIYDFISKEEFESKSGDYPKLFDFGGFLTTLWDITDALKNQNIKTYRPKHFDDIVEMTKSTGHDRNYRYFLNLFIICEYFGVTNDIKDLIETKNIPKYSLLKNNIKEDYKSILEIIDLLEFPI